MIKRIFACALSLILLCGCSVGGQDDVSSVQIPVTDYPAMAFDITVEECPQKVVSLIPEITDIIVALGSDAQLAAISDNCVQVREAERVGSAFLPDTAKIKEIGADLVFTSDVTSKTDIEILKNAGINVAIVEPSLRYTDLPNMYKNIATLISGNITGQRNAANTFSGIDEKIKNLSNQSNYAVTAAILVADGIFVSSGCVTADLAAFAGVTVSDAENAEAIICSEAMHDETAAKYPDKRVIIFDISLLERRGADMYNAVATLGGTLKAK